MKCINIQNTLVCSRSLYPYLSIHKHTTTFNYVRHTSTCEADQFWRVLALGRGCKRSFRRHLVPGSSYRAALAESRTTVAHSKHKMSTKGDVVRWHGKRGYTEMEYRENSSRTKEEMTWSINESMGHMISRSVIFNVLNFTRRKDIAKLLNEYTNSHFLHSCYH